MPALYLDSVRDPGNLGTIIRTADWFGIEVIFSSTDTVDFYNPKVITATMGSFTRIEVIKIEQQDALELAHANNYAVATLELDGQNLYTADIPERSLFVMGSESHGVSDIFHDSADKKITIPLWGKAESLNVSIATAVTLSEYRRRYS